MARHEEVSDRMRVLGGGITVGDYITTNKPTDVWWKVESIRTQDHVGHAGFTRYFAVINKGGYRKEIIDMSGTGRRFYKWINTEER